MVLQQSPYDSEKVLQKALAQFPQVIAGATTSGVNEPQLLLISREMSVPGGDASGRSFSLDHLFIDSECVPVFVEVKRASDTRIRREVVGQMLDYAANGVKYWPITALQDALTKRATSENRDAALLIKDLYPDLELAEFWRRVEDNLRTGNVRLLFVADSLPSELVSIIEFLNEHLSPVEVLGVELQQFKSGEHIAYVPVVRGQTNAAASAKTSGGGLAWSRETFLEAAESRVSDAEMELIARLFADVDGHQGGKLNWGKGATPGVAGWYTLAGRPTAVWNLNANTESPTSRAYLYFYLADHVAIVGAEQVAKAGAILESIPSMKAKIDEARANDWMKYPSVYLPDIAGNAAQEAALLGAIKVLLENPAGVAVETGKAVGPSEPLSSSLLPEGLHERRTDL